MRGVFEKLEDLYYSIVPYAWRPKNLWYSFTCFIWYRYRTVKPRTLPGHQFCDCVELLPHAIFEILCRFVENELPGHIDWEGSGHTIEVGGSPKNVYNVWMDIYEWWNKRYLPLSETRLDKWGEFQRLHCKHEFNPIENSKNLSWDTIYDSPENEKESHRLFMECSELERVLEEELEENLILILKCRSRMWT